MKLTPKEKSAIDFMKGYVCAIATLLRIDGVVQASTRELFSAGVGNITIKGLEEIGIDQYDLEILQEHWVSLRYKAIIKG